MWIIIWWAAAAAAAAAYHSNAMCVYSSQSPHSHESEENTATTTAWKAFYLYVCFLVCPTKDLKLATANIVNGSGYRGTEQTKIRCFRATTEPPLVDVCFCFGWLSFVWVRLLSVCSGVQTTSLCSHTQTFVLLTQESRAYCTSYTYSPVHSCPVRWRARTSCRSARDRTARHRRTRGTPPTASVLRHSPCTDCRNFPTPSRNRPSVPTLDEISTPLLANVTLLYA